MRSETTISRQFSNCFFASMLLLVIGLLLSNAGWAQNQQLQKDAKRPNVIIFLADDLGWADLGFRGSPIETPNIDRLAREGTELNRFYATPICSPTRAALMTGRDPVRLGVLYATILPWLNHGIHTSEYFLSESFKHAGYETAMTGKWHLGHSQQQFHPNYRGFDLFYGHLHTEVGYYPPFSNLGGTDFQRNGVTIDDRGYETYLLADEATQWIKGRNPDKPFFLYVPFLAPHTPLDAPDELKRKYSTLVDDRKPARSPVDDISRVAKATGGRSQRQVYAAVVDAMDRAIGRVLDTLDSEGITNNTIVIFFSDNGGQAVFGAGGASNYPLRGGKGETFEGGIRVPALIRWPGKIPAGISMNQMMTVMDIFPTLAEAANLPTKKARPFDGISMWPSIIHQEPAKRKKPVIFASETPIYGSLDFAVFDGEWKLVQEMERNQESITILNRLFNIVADPLETNNLARQHPDKVRKMEKLLRRWRSLYPISGVRSQLIPPPGWHAPNDWASYPKPVSILQDKPSFGMAPPGTIRPLDYQHGKRGRLIYDCNPVPILNGGFCLPGTGEHDNLR